MSYPRNKLDRLRQNELSAQPGDRLYLHQYQGSTWVVLEDEGGDTLLRLYSVTDQQLADLHADIGRHLRLAPAATIDHLRKLRELLDDILKRDEAEQQQAAEQAWQQWNHPPASVDDAAAPGDVPAELPTELPSVEPADEPAPPSASRRPRKRKPRLDEEARGPA